MGEPDLSPIYPEVEKMAILEEETHREFGYYSTDLTPKSDKKIIVRCNLCGEKRIIRKRSYRTLCISCAGKGKTLTDSAKQKISKARRGKPLTEGHKRKLSECHADIHGEKHWNWGGGKAISFCAFCGKQINIWPSAFREDIGNFCSKDCYKSWQTEFLNGEKSPNYGKHHSEATRKKISDANKGENSSNWKGGISFEPYCHKFNEEFKQYIRDKFGNVCFLCGKTEEENKQKLSVHHVNYQKSCGCANTEEDKKVDDNACQFVPLCRSCNAKVNKDRDMWERKIKNKLRNKLNGWYI